MEIIGEGLKALGGAWAVAYIFIYGIGFLIYNDKATSENKFFRDRRGGI